MHFLYEQWLAAIEMEKYRNSLLLKTVLIITFVAFTVSSLSPDFMSNILGVGDEGPFINFFYKSCFIGAQAIGWNISEQREAGIFAMLVFLITILFFYVLCRIYKSISTHYKSANKAN